MPGKPDLSIALNCCSNSWPACFDGVGVLQRAVEHLAEALYWLLSDKWYGEVSYTEAELVSDPPLSEGLATLVYGRGNKRRGARGAPLQSFLCTCLRSELLLGMGIAKRRRPEATATLLLILLAHQVIISSRVAEIKDYYDITQRLYFLVRAAKDVKCWKTTSNQNPR